MRRPRTPAELARIRNPIDRARAAAETMNELRRLIGEVAQLREAAVREAVEAGTTRSDVARALGVSPQAITNLLNGH